MWRWHALTARPEPHTEDSRAVVIDPNGFPINGAVHRDQGAWVRSLRPASREAANLTEEGRDEEGADNDEGDQRCQRAQGVEIRLDDLHGQHRPQLEGQRV